MKIILAKIVRRSVEILQRYSIAREDRTFAPSGASVVAKAMADRSSGRPVIDNFFVKIIFYDAFILLYYFTIVS